MSQGRKSVRLMPGWSREKFDAIAETSQFADHLARSDLGGRGADGQSSLLVAHALVQDLPDQSTEPVGDGANGLRMAKPGDEPKIHDREDGALRLDRGVGRLIQDAGKRRSGGADFRNDLVCGIDAQARDFREALHSVMMLSAIC
ncbi:MAG TPA: hypothetical protein VMP00_00465 [Burkholderiales bacterium]|nr:hypothetical protein [Burkholderiales bacterium]